MNIKDLKDEDLNSNTPVIGTQVQLSLLQETSLPRFCQTLRVHEQPHDLIPLFCFFP